MMNQQQPDKFFREKLENFQRPAPTAAWDRIETNLKKNNTKAVGWWWKVAASFLLLATAVDLLWPAKISKQSLSTISKQSEIIAPESKPDANKVEPVTTPQASVKLLEPTPKTITAKKTKAVKKNPIQTPPAAENSSARTLASSFKNESSPESLVEVSETIVADAKVESAPAPQVKKIRLQFSAEETNKYLDENAVAQATSEEKKSSTLKKLLRKANDLKSNQDPFGDLREKKNEILALNFKNEKRGQNK